MVDDSRAARRQFLRGLVLFGGDPLGALEGLASLEDPYEAVDGLVVGCLHHEETALFHGEGCEPCIGP